MRLLTSWPLIGSMSSRDHGKWYNIGWFKPEQMITDVTLYAIRTACILIKYKTNLAIVFVLIISYGEESHGR